jgi:hypothetical protein
MRVGYVVLHANDAEACRQLWVERVGMVEKRRDEVGEHQGMWNFAFSDPEGRWFAVTR